MHQWAKLNFSTGSIILKRDKISLKSDKNPGCLSTNNRNELVTKICWVSVKWQKTDICEQGIFSQVHSTTDDTEAERKLPLCGFWLAWISIPDENFLKNIITCDEMWVHYAIITMGSASSLWQTSGGACQRHSKTKVMLFYCDGIVNHEDAPQRLLTSTSVYKCWDISIMQCNANNYK